MADAIEHSVLSPDLKLKQKIPDKYVLPWTIMFQQVCLLIRKTLQPFFYQFYLIKFKNNSQQREITDHNDKQINEMKNLPLLQDRSVVDVFYYYPAFQIKQTVLE